MAPEVMADPGQTQSSSGSEEVVKYPFKSDIYSFGMLCYEILTGRDPFWKIRSLLQVKQKVLRGEHPELSLVCPADLETLIVRCWNFEASARPSITEICKELQYIQWCIFLDQDQAKMERKPRKEPGFGHWACFDQTPVYTYGYSESDVQPDVPHSVHSLPWKGDISKLKLKRRLGRGGSDNANVFLSTWQYESNVEDVAQKMFLVREYFSAGNFWSEVLIMKDLYHPNIVRFFCYVEDERTRSIVMELMDGDLNNLLKRRLAEDTTLAGPFPMNEAVDMMLQIAAGMNYLHQQNIIHRDLKSDNILFRNVKEGKWDIKVADFGLSKVIRPHDKFQSSRERAPHGIDESNMATYEGNIGTIRWMAPELMSIHGNEDEDKVDAVHNPYGSDVYSFAMVCSEILTGHVPFSDIQDASEVQTKVREGERPVLPSHCPPKLKALIGRCWHPVSQERPSFGKIIEELEVILRERCNYQSLGT